MAGTPLAAGGLYWLGQLNSHSTYAADILPAMLILAAGLGLMFLHTALAAGYTSGLKVGAVIIAANFLVAAFMLPRRARTAPGAA